MEKAKRKKKVRRVRYTPDKPLELRGTVPGTESVPSRRGGLGRVLGAFVGALPAYTAGTRAGRDRAIWIRGAIGAAALLLVAVGRDDWRWGLGGLAVALTLFLVPIPDVRKRRWLAAAARLGEPTQRAIRAEAELHYDGKKLTVRSGGRVWRSLRPANPPHDLVVRLEDDLLLLGLVPAGKRADTVWFAAPAAEVAEPPPLTPEASTPAPGEAMALDGAGWTLLYDGLTVPPKGPACQPKKTATATPGRKRR